MALDGVHVLLTYTCLYECDHCFLYCGPSAQGTFTARQLDELMDEVAKVDSVTRVYFEGGESFLFYPLLLHGVRLARAAGFKVGLVTNAYWATSVEDAIMWLEPLRNLGIDELSLSDDAFHFGGRGVSPARKAAAAADRLGVPHSLIEIEPPAAQPKVLGDKGEPIIGGDVRLRGRAVEKCLDGLPLRSREAFTICPYEDLDALGRVHVDAFGHVQVCQGLSIGNFLKTPFSEIIQNYRPENHPLIRDLKRGGPAALAAQVEVGSEFVDACHCCYVARRALIDRYPERLAPRQVYGLNVE